MTRGSYMDLMRNINRSGDNFCGSLEPKGFTHNFTKAK